MARHDTLAAVDLGSNSFHLEIGRVVERQIYPLDAVREVVRLGAGLTADKRIDRATQARALESLAKMAERLRGFPRQAVRAVGTNALRVAKNAPQFLREARQVLGFPIEVISGREEARLIYVGVAHAMPAALGSKIERRLVVDVGGGSTEFIVGAGLEPQLTESLSRGPGPACPRCALHGVRDLQPQVLPRRQGRQAGDARRRARGPAGARRHRARVPRGRMGRGSGLLGHRALHREYPARERIC